MKYILHIDTSAETAVVALGGDGKLIASRENTEARNHASVLNNFISEILHEAGIRFADLSAIAVCGGPGSYTGLRIGLSTAKGLCYALDIPLLMHNQLLLMVLPAIYSNGKKYDNFMAILSARDKEYFIASYDVNFKSIIDARHINEDEMGFLSDEMAKTRFIIAPELILENLIKNNIQPTQRYEGHFNINSWISYTYEAYNCNDFVKTDYAEPYYLKQVYTHNTLKSN